MGEVVSGVWGQNPRRWRQGGVVAEPPATENFCIFYLKKVNFSAFNCIICCNNVLYIMHIIQTQNTWTSYDLSTILNIQLLQYVMLQYGSFLRMLPTLFTHNGCFHYNLLIGLMHITVKISVIRQNKN